MTNYVCIAYVLSMCSDDSSSSPHWACGDSHYKQVCFYSTLNVQNSGVSIIESTQQNPNIFNSKRISTSLYFHFFWVYFLKDLFLLPGKVLVLSAVRTLLSSSGCLLSCIPTEGDPSTPIYFRVYQIWDSSLSSYPWTGQLLDQGLQFSEIISSKK